MKKEKTSVDAETVSPVDERRRVRQPAPGQRPRKVVATDADRIAHRHSREDLRHLIAGAYLFAHAIAEGGWDGFREQSQRYESVCRVCFLDAVASLVDLVNHGASWEEARLRHLHARLMDDETMVWAFPTRELRVSEQLESGGPPVYPVALGCPC